MAKKGEDNNQIAEVAKEIKASANSSSKSETILNIVKAGLTSTPFLGGFSSLITDYIPSERFLRVERLVEQVTIDLTVLQDKVNTDYILSNEFAYIFEKAMKGAAENYQKEKLEAFRGILINSTIDFNSSEEEKEYYLNLVNNLTSLHLRILRFMFDPDIYIKSRQLSKESFQGGFAQFFPVAIPGIHIDVIKSAFDDLYKYGLINTDKSIFSTMTSGQGLALLGDRLTTFGKSFIHFCISPNTEVE